MNILALDTSLGACSAAVVTGSAQAPEIFGAFELREREHAEVLVPMIEQVLEEAGVSWSGIDAIAVTVGPGSFTGVRVGVAAARGFALALDKPVIAATSLEVMAAQTLEELSEHPDVFGVAVDARRGEVYLALFDSTGATVLPPAALTPRQAATEALAKGAALVAGSGAPLVAESHGPDTRRIDTVFPGLQPDARALARLALTRAPCEDPVSPLYLRPPDAKPQTGKAVPRRR